MSTKIKYFVLLVEMWKKQSEYKFYILTNVGKIYILKLALLTKEVRYMEHIEDKVTEYLADIRESVKDHPKKRTLDKKLDYLEDVFNFIINYIYAEQDNLNDLDESLKGNK
jgi:hypothetical protein